MAEMEVVEQIPDETLILPIAGRGGKIVKYEVQPASAEWWYRFAALRQMWTDQQNKVETAPEDLEAVEMLDKLGHAGMQVACLGKSVAAQMLKDGVSAADFRRAVNTAFVWHATGGNDEAAATTWSGKAAAPRTTSTSTAAAPTTKRPGSGSTTRSPRKR